MKNSIINSFFRLAAAIALLASAGACKDDVALPKKTIALSTHTILAPSFATTLSFDVRSNCAWSISVQGEDTSWAELSQTEATGMATISVTIPANEGALRSVTIRVASKPDAAAADCLTFIQASATAEGFLSIPDLRKLAEEGDYTVAEDVKMRGIVVSSVQDNNYFENCTALQGAQESGYGITLRTDEPLFRNPGEELEVELNGAVIGVNAQTGALEVKPLSDDRITRSETSKITPAATAVSYADIASGGFESMYVSIDVQVMISDVNKIMSDNVTVQTADDERFVMRANQASTFGIDKVPVGSGKLSGIVVKHAGAYAVMPCTANDIKLASPRFDGGITLPYVLSFMTASANNGDGKYVFFSGNDANGTGFIDGVAITAKDGTGASVTAKASSTGGNLGFRYWHEASGHHNLPIKSWIDGKDKDYVLFTLPLNEAITGPFRISLGISSSGTGPANWFMTYSNDNITWYTPAPADQPHFVIPSGKTVGSSKNFFYYTLDVTPAIPLERRGTLYVRVMAFNQTTVNNGVTAAGGEPRFHSCFVVEKVPSFSTAKPAGAIYFEPFDKLTAGLDYRHGDKLAGMLNFCGSNISAWDAATKNGLSGTNVCQRPGYAQIGWVETQTVAHTALTNNVGSLATPAFGEEGTLTLTFDAMAYKNTAVYGTAALDRNGDLTSAVVEVIGGGTIGGATKKVITGMSYTEFKVFTLQIDGATASTSVRFTSEPAAGQFSRWFVDNICVTK